MDASQERELNQAAYRRLRETINQTYPPDRFVAIAGGKIVADAASFPELDSILHQQGYHTPEVLIVQAGVDYLEDAMILTQAMQS